MYLEDPPQDIGRGAYITIKVMDIEFSDSLPDIYTQHQINLNQIEASAPQLIAGKT
jgi:hypothetical protein